MRENSFIYGLIGLGFLVVLCATPFPGAMIGFFFGITVAFFLAPIALLIQALAGLMGIPLEIKQIMIVFVGIYFLLLIPITRSAWGHWRHDRVEQARAITLLALFFLLLPVMGYVSSQAMIKAWP